MLNTQQFSHYFKEVEVEKFQSDDAFNLKKFFSSLSAFFPVFPQELWELEVEDRHNFFLAELSRSIGVDIQPDASARFAFASYSQEQGKEVWFALDMSDEYIWSVYFFGWKKGCLELQKTWIQCLQVRRFFFSSQVLISLAKRLGTILRFQYRFRQLRGVGEDIQMEGAVQGNLSNQLFLRYREEFPAYFNVTQVKGYGFGENVGAIDIRNAGTLFSDEAERYSFVEICSEIKDILTQNHKAIRENWLLAWNINEKTPGLSYIGEPLEIEFREKIENVDAFVRQLTSGGNPFQLLGVSQRISRKLWRISSVEVHSGDQIEIEVTQNLIRFFIRSVEIIPLVLKIERLLQQHVDAAIERLHV